MRHLDVIVDVDVVVDGDGDGDVIAPRPRSARDYPVAPYRVIEILRGPEALVGLQVRQCPAIAIVPTIDRVLMLGAPGIAFSGRVAVSLASRIATVVVGTPVAGSAQGEQQDGHGEAITHGFEAAYLRFSIKARVAR